MFLIEILRVCTSKHIKIMTLGGKDQLDDIDAYVTKG